METPDLLRCPLCRSPLTPTEGGLRCANRHSFDRARQGYYHLLPVQNKRSRAPGDDRDMVDGRRRFLDQGYYRPLSDAVNRLLIDALAATPEPRLLDCGCGEGYYTERLASALSQAGTPPALIGLDISKAAIRQACRRSRAVTWVVASGADLPLAEGRFDALLCLFAPLASESFRRTLKTGGTLLVATTGADHLLELRQQIYPEVHRRAFDPAPALAPHFDPGPVHPVRYTLDLEGSGTILDLLAMTPHQWRTRPETRRGLEALQRLQVRVDVNLQCFTRR